MMGCFAAGAVLVSFGVVIGKVSPLQLLALTMIEVPIYFANMHIGAAIIQAVDCGKWVWEFLTNVIISYLERLNHRRLYVPSRLWCLLWPCRISGDEQEGLRPSGYSGPPGLQVRNDL